MRRKYASLHRSIFMPVLVFDLDDTLYPELSYVHGGFRAVAAFLSPILRVPAEALAAGMITDEAEQGRGQVFDNVLRQHGRWSKTLVAACLRTYRQHRPELRLFPDAERCLRRFAALPLYLVTDGHKEVPARKVAAQLARLQTLAVVRLIENQTSSPEPAPVYEPNQPCHYRI